MLCYHMYCINSAPVARQASRVGMRGIVAAHSIPTQLQDSTDGPIHWTRQESRSADSAHGSLKIAIVYDQRLHAGLELLRNRHEVRMSVCKCTDIGTEASDRAAEPKRYHMSFIKHLSSTGVGQVLQSPTLFYRIEEPLHKHSAQANWCGLQNEPS